MQFIEISNLLRHNLACCGGPEMGLLGGSDGLLGQGLVYGHLWWVILSNLLEGQWGVALEIGIFKFWTFFGCFGGPEIMIIVCLRCV